ncbi:MAG: hypothetical protein JXB32_12135 [Deltaproteobacteria bacterium]|nr:hypothetical protein [Deltaproteobacteria bacterium]
MARRERFIARHEVAVEQDGKRFVGSYAVDRGMITVHFAMTSETTQVGDSPPEALAELLLHELVSKHRKDSKGQTHAAPAPSPPRRGNSGPT